MTKKEWQPGGPLGHPMSYIFMTGLSGTRNLSYPLKSNTIYSFFPLNLDHIKAATFPSWKQISPCNELLPSVFLPSLLC